VSFGANDERDNRIKKVFLNIYKFYYGNLPGKPGIVLWSETTFQII